MRVVLVGPEIEESLSIRYLQSALEAAGHSCSVVPFGRAQEVRSVARDVLEYKPRLVGLSLVAQRRFEDFRRLTERLREIGYRGHITAGGHFASLRACEVMANVPALDSILHHDGEERIVRLAAGLHDPVFPHPGLDGITWRGADGVVQHRPPRRVADLDALRPPSRRKPDRILGLPRAPLVSSRGCAGACSFCSIHAWHRQVPSRRLRLRAPRLVAEEMVDLHRQRRVRVFVFHDDDFIHPDPRRAMDRCRAILDAAVEGIGEPFGFVLKCRPDDVEEDLFAYLKSRGLVRVYVGIETHSRLGMRVLNRGASPEVNDRALDTLRRLGVYACFNLLAFHPETTLEELEENLAFLERRVDHPFDIARTELYARSTLEDRMVREGRVLGDYRGYDYRISDPRAEAVFRRFADVLWDRHFGGRSILHRTQDLGLRMSLLRHFYPRLATLDAQERVDALIREVNTDTVRYVRRLVHSVLEEGTAETMMPAGGGLEELRSEVADRIRHQGNRWVLLTAEFETRAWLGRRGWDGWAGAAAFPHWVTSKASAMPLAALLLGVLSCADGPGQVCDPVPPPPVHFTTDLEPYLDRACATSGCHAGSEPAAGLDLKAGSSYSGLVGVPSTQVPGQMRVARNDPEHSYLLHKLRGTQTEVGGVGDRMPKGGVPDGSFISRVAEWIRQGAGRE